MNPQAIMTPGGIADQFTRGLSGVAQAFAQRSQIDRQAQQDAFSQQRALEQDRMAREAFNRQGDWHSADERQQAAAFKLQQDAALRAKDAFDLSQIQANPDAYPNHPVAQRLIQERNRVDQLNQFKTGALGMPLFGTPDIPIGSYIPEDKQAQVAGYNTYTAAQALANKKITSGQSGHLGIDDRMRLQGAKTYENLLKMRNGNAYLIMDDDAKKKLNDDLEYFSQFRAGAVGSPALVTQKPVAGFDANAMFPPSEAE